MSVWAQAPQYIWDFAPRGTNREDFFKVAYQGQWLYVVGSFNDSIVYGPGQFVVTNGNYDVVIAKLDTATGQVVWMKSIGGSNTDNGLDIEVSGNRLYIVGRFTGTVDFDPGSGTATLTGNGSRDGFILVLDTAGNYIRAGGVGSDQFDEAYDLALIGDSLLVVVGNFRDTADLDPGPGTYQQISQGSNDGFILLLDTALNLRWALTLGAGQSDKLYSVDVDLNGNIYVAGYVRDTVDLDPTSGTSIYQPTTTQADIAIISLTKDTVFRWAAAIGSGSGDYAYGVEVHGHQVFLTGYFQGTVDFDPGAGTHNVSATGSADVFLWVLDTAGNFRWVATAGGSGFDRGSHLYTVDSFVYVIGRFKSTAADFDPTSGVFLLAPMGDYDIFVWKLDTTGAFQWARHMGGPLQDRGYHLVVVPPSLYIVGTYNSTAYLGPWHSGPARTAANQWDPFVVKWSENCTPILAPPQTASACTYFVLPSGDTVYTSGTYMDTLVSATGCDSIVPFMVTIIPPVTVNLPPQSACDTFWSPAGHPITVSGIYSDTLTAVSTGCDSIVTYQVTIYHDVMDTFQVTGCGSYTLPNGQVVTSPGIYPYDTLATVHGCDSFVYVEVSIVTIDTHVNAVGNVLNAAPGADAYQWVSCPDMTPIPGATGASFTPTQSGSYAVVITVGSCQDTSSCHQVNISGVSWPSQPALSYDGRFLQATFDQPVTVRVMDVAGRTLGTWTHTQQVHIDMQQWPAGWYLIEVQQGDERYRTRLWVP